MSSNSESGEISLHKVEEEKEHIILQNRYKQQQKLNRVLQNVIKLTLCAFIHKTLDITSSCARQKDMNAHVCLSARNT